MGSSTYSFFQLFVSSWYKSLRRTRVRIIIFQETGLIMPGGLFLGTQLPFHTWGVHLQFCKGRRFSRAVRRSVCFWRSRIGSRFGVGHCHHRCRPEIAFTVVLGKNEPWVVILVLYFLSYIKMGAERIDELGAKMLTSNAHPCRIFSSVVWYCSCPCDQVDTCSHLLQAIAQAPSDLWPSKS